MYHRALFDEEHNVTLGNFGTSYAIGKLSSTSVRISDVFWAGSYVTSDSYLSVYCR